VEKIVFYLFGTSGLNPNERKSIHELRPTSIMDATNLSKGVLKTGSNACEIDILCYINFGKAILYDI
jgi:hypothetical protein